MGHRYWDELGCGADQNILWVVISALTLVGRLRVKSETYARHCRQGTRQHSRCGSGGRRPHVRIHLGAWIKEGGCISQLSSNQHNGPFKMSVY